MGTMTGEWRTVEVRIPPEDHRFPKGWWVNTRTGECVDGALPAPGTPSSQTAGPRERALRLRDAVAEARRQYSEAAGGPRGANAHAIWEAKIRKYNAACLEAAEAGEWPLDGGQGEDAAAGEG